MTYKINPDDVCRTPRCGRPKETGEEFCTGCIRLARAVGRSVEDMETDLAREGKEYDSLEQAVVSGGDIPRCVVYLSMAGDVMTMELTGEPKFTEVDVDIVVAALIARRAA